MIVRSPRPIPRSRTLILPALALVGLLLSGCSSESGPRLFPVAGRVLLDGIPLAGGSVTLRLESTQDGWEQPTGAIEADGRYRVYTRGRAGAPAGRYVVVVFSTTSRPGSEGAAHPGLPESAIPTRYNDPATSSLKVTVSESPADFDLELNRDNAR